MNMHLPPCDEAAIDPRRLSLITFQKDVSWLIATWKSSCWRKQNTLPSTAHRPFKSSSQTDWDYTAVERSSNSIELTLFTSIFQCIKPISVLLPPKRSIELKPDRSPTILKGKERVKTDGLATAETLHRQQDFCNSPFPITSYAVLVTLTNRI